MTDSIPHRDSHATAARILEAYNEGFVEGRATRGALEDALARLALCILAQAGEHGIDLNAAVAQRLRAQSVADHSRDERD